MLQTHRVIDPQPASMAHIGAEELDETMVALFPQCARVKRRQSPVLAGRIVNIGWRADLSSRYYGSCIGPGLRARTVGAHCEIAIQAHSHAQVLRLRGCGAELLVRHPLEPSEEIDTIPVFRREAHDRW